MSIIDTSTEFGQRVAQRLADEQVAWLVTVDSSGTPQPVPIWFLWDGESALIYSQPNQAKIRNIERHGRASLNFNSDFNGGDVVVLTGAAEVDRTAPSAEQNPAFIEKYADGFVSIDMTSETFAASYSVPLRVTPTKLRGF